jgi:hypothetical protein
VIQQRVFPSSVVKSSSNARKSREIATIGSFFAMQARIDGWEHP